MASPYSVNLLDKELRFEKTELAEQANGAMLAQIGDTVVLVTAVMAPSNNSNQGFFPLSVEYEERFYAAGKILGSRFVRREGKPSDEAILTARLIDRAIRPLFPKGFMRETQVILTCLSWDGLNDPDVAGLNGASLALLLSDIPWEGPVAAVRVGRTEGAFVLNPTYEQRDQGDLDLVFAGVREKDDVLINMIEAGAKELKEEALSEALIFAKPHLKELLSFQERLKESAGKEKIAFSTQEAPEALEKEVKNFLGSRLQEALFEGDKKTRMQRVNDLKGDLVEMMESLYPGMGKRDPARDIFEDEIDRLVHEAAIKEQQRVDGRRLDEIRPMEAKAAILPRTHGSGLFIRGQTKTLSLLTLGAPGDQKLVEGMEFIGKKRFLHHYNFPPYAPGEIKPLRGPGRREIGHGMLAEKALAPLIPPMQNFPYTVRIVTEVLSSNGSTSMASVCSSSLALMDAGVPIARPAAGISIGLMSNQRGSWELLTDIQGPEDHHGDMDFKIAGTAEGITAMQLDVKIRGLTHEQFRQALEAAKEARLRILKEVLLKTLEKPRPELSPLAPRISVFQINPEKIGMVIGPGGKTINRIIEEFGVEIDVDDSGEIFVTGDNPEGVQKAVDEIRAIVREVQAGEVFTGKVKRIMDFGAFVEVLPGQEGLVHISQLDHRRVNKVTDVLKVGDLIPVKVIEIDEQGRINLSLKQARSVSSSRASGPEGTRAFGASATTNGARPAKDDRHPLPPRNSSPRMHPRKR